MKFPHTLTHNIVSPDSLYSNLSLFRTSQFALFYPSCLTRQDSAQLNRSLYPVAKIAYEVNAKCFLVERMKSV